MSIEMESLLRRVQKLEDELATHRLIVRYGFAVDSGDADALVALFTEDARYQIDSAYVTGGEPYVLSGHDDLRAMIDSERHRELRPRCAHTLGPVVVEVDGDVAHATGYSRVYWGAGDSAELHRLSANEWRCARLGGRWLISERRSVLVGSATAQALLNDGLQPRSTSGD